MVLIFFFFSIQLQALQSPEKNLFKNEGKILRHFIYGIIKVSSMKKDTSSLHDRICSLLANNPLVISWIGESDQFLEEKIKKADIEEQKDIIMSLFQDKIIENDQINNLIKMPELRGSKETHESFFIWINL